MVSTLDSYKKKKEFLVCIDSDGCAMDTMDIKHFRCFGPCLVSEWQLDQWKEEVLTLWNEINLYSLTRGINRFKGLALALIQISNKYKKIEELDSLIEWTEKEQELSMHSLKRALDKNNSISLKKAFFWSEAVNKSISEISDEDIKPFQGVLESITYISQKADIAIVSSANAEAVHKEWGKYGLLEKTDIMLTQETGTKAYCIEIMLRKGYDANKVLMVGDAPGDKKAADGNGICFYPILVKKEADSWNELRNTAFEQLIQEKYAGTYQELLNNKFLNNLR